MSTSPRSERAVGQLLTLYAVRPVRIIRRTPRHRGDGGSGARFPRITLAQRTLDGRTGSRYRPPHAGYPNFEA